MATVDSVLVERPTVYGNTGENYKVAEVIMPNVATEEAAGAGDPVTLHIDFSEKNLPADLNYCVLATPHIACAVHSENKAIDGFDIVLTPLSAGVTLAASSVDINVQWAL